MAPDCAQPFCIIVSLDRHKNYVENFDLPLNSVPRLRREGRELRRNPRQALTQGQSTAGQSAASTALAKARHGKSGGALYPISFSDKMQRKQ